LRARATCRLRQHTDIGFDELVRYVGYDVHTGCVLRAYLQINEEKPSACEGHRG